MRTKAFFLILILFFQQNLKADENKCFGDELDKLMAEQPGLALDRPAVTSEMKKMAKETALYAKKGEYAVMKTPDGEDVYVQVIRPPHIGPQSETVMDVQILSGDLKGKVTSLSLDKGQLDKWTPGQFSNDANKILKEEKIVAMQRAKQKLSSEGVLKTNDEIKAVQKENFGLIEGNPKSQIILSVEGKSTVGVPVRENVKVSYFKDKNGRHVYKEDDVKFGNSTEPGRTFYTDTPDGVLYAEEISDSGEVKKIYHRILEVRTPQRK